MDRSPNSQPHTRRISSSRPNARPGCRRKNASRSNSRMVRASSAPVADGAAGAGVQREAAGAQPGRPRAPARRGPGAAQHRLHPQHQLAGAERLGDVVVGADLQAQDPVVLVAARGQHDHRAASAAARAGAGGTPPGRPCRAASGRAPPGPGGRRRPGEGGRAVGGQVDVEARRGPGSRRRPRRRSGRRRRPGRGTAGCRDRSGGHGPSLGPRVSGRSRCARTVRVP